MDDSKADKQQIRGRNNREHRKKFTKISKIQHSKKEKNNIHIKIKSKNESSQIQG